MKIKEITSDYALFDDGTKLSSYHDQDCCENVYADFEQLKTTAIENEEFTYEDLLQMQGIEDTGVKIKGYLIPCYNSQNGYYSSNLEMVVESPNKPTVKIDVSNFVEDQIN